MKRFFQHYKNKPYKLLGTARHSETLEEFALYETLYENKLGKIWVRPQKMFFENLPSGEPRFRERVVEFRELKSVGATEIELFRSLADATFPGWAPEKVLAKKSLLILAYIDGVLAGFKIGYAESEPGVFYSWLGAVHPDYRGMGLGEEMMSRQHAYCAKSGFKVVRTKSGNPYKAMMRLNLKMGFDIVGTEAGPRGLKILMEKTL